MSTNGRVSDIFEVDVEPPPTLVYYVSPTPPPPKGDGSFFRRQKQFHCQRYSRLGLLCPKQPLRN
jgi:hypothetical protein